MVVVVVCCRRETVGCCWIGASTAADEAVDAVEVVDEDFIRFVDDDDVGCVCWLLLVSTDVVSW